MTSSATMTRCPLTAPAVVKMSSEVKMRATSTTMTLTAPARAAPVICHQYHQAVIEPAPQSLKAQRRPRLGHDAPFESSSLDPTTHAPLPNPAACVGRDTSTLLTSFLSVQLAASPPCARVSSSTLSTGGTAYSRKLRTQYSASTTRRSLTPRWLELLSAGLSARTTRQRPGGSCIDSCGRSRGPPRPYRRMQRRQKSSV
jgi:hypothetical protein